MGVRRPYLVSMYLQSSTLWVKYKESIKKVKNSLNSLWSSIECTVTFRMTAITIPRQVIDGDAVQADSRCTCIFQSSCEWYFINFVGKFGNLIGYAIWAAAVIAVFHLYINNIIMVIECCFVIVPGLPVTLTHAGLYPFLISFLIGAVMQVFLYSSKINY